MPLSFRNKIFFFLASLIAMAIVLILLILNSQIKDKMKATLVVDLERICNILSAYQQSRAELLRIKSNFLAEEPRLKAAIETGDSETVSREVQKFQPIVETDFFVVTDASAKVLTSIGALPANVRTGAEIPSIAAALRYEQAAKLVIIADRIFYIISTPVTILDQFERQVLLGTISIGQQINAAFLAQVRMLTGCEVGFVVEHDAAGASRFWQQFSFQDRSVALSSHPLDSLIVPVVTMPRAREMKVRGQAYLAQSVALLPDPPRHGLLLLRSLDETLTPILAPIQNSLFVFGLISLLLALLFSYLLSRNITSPVMKLVEAAQQIGQGNLETPVGFAGKDEIGFLAAQFEQMRLSLKKNLEELQKTHARLVQSEKLATTGKLLAQLSHEINNPIHNIRSALEASLKKCDRGHPAQKLLEVAHEEILRLAKLVRQTLDFYRQGPRERAPVNVNDLLQELIAVSERNFSRSHVRIHTALAAPLAKVHANKDQLKQVFLNMMLNAKEAMPSGGLLSISTRNVNNGIQIEFTDTGVGIPEENLDKIFDAFFTTKSQISGVGLGLSVSYEIIRQHNGSIAVASEVNKGTSFIIHLPVD
ncbi:MAG: ATP-binding protein [candidate division KSB1 bacterium]|nr:ATP-binding protein [candidate division KSB1 bacterium]MDZ7314271.1 ATP-binding protein [candidate division KSB1 bacterium]